MGGEINLHDKSNNTVAKIVKPAGSENLEHELPVTGKKLISDVDLAKEKDNIGLNAKMRDLVLSESAYKALVAKRIEDYAGSGLITQPGQAEIAINKTLWVAEDNEYHTKHLQLGRREAAQAPLLNVKGNIIRLIGTECPVLHKDGMSYQPDNQNTFSFPSAENDIVKLNSTVSNLDIKRGDYVELAESPNLVDAADANFSTGLTNLVLRTHGKEQEASDAMMEIDANGRLKITQNTTVGAGAIFKFPFKKGVRYTVRAVIAAESTVGGRLVLTRDNGSADHIEFSYDNKGDVEVTFIASGYQDELMFGVGYTTAENVNTIFESFEIVTHGMFTAIENITSGEDILEVNKVVAINGKTRQDAVMIETWHELVTDKDIVYPYGNVQYNGADIDGLSGLTVGTFTGSDTYSLFGNWQPSGQLVGKGYIWSAMSEEDKIAFISNYENNVYLSKDGYVQVRYRIRILHGQGNCFNNGFNNDNGWITTDTSGDYGIKPKGQLVNITKDISFYGDEILSCYENEHNNHIIYLEADGIPDAKVTSQGVYRSIEPTDVYLSGNRTDIYRSQIFSYDKYSYAIPMATVQRRNMFIYDPVHNPAGCAMIYVAGEAKEFWEVTDTLITSFDDCCNPDLIAVVDKTNTANAGTLAMLKAGAIDTTVYELTGKFDSTLSGRPDGLFLDQIGATDVRDLMMFGNRIEDTDSFLKESVAKIIDGNTICEGGLINLRPLEANGHMPIWLSNNNIEVRSVIQFYTKDHPFDNNRTNIYPHAYEAGEMVRFYTTSGGFIEFRIINKQSGNQSYRGIITKVSGITLANFTQYKTTNFWKPKDITFLVPVELEEGYNTNNYDTKCLIIGKQANYPTEWKTFGAPGHLNIIDEDGTEILPSTFIRNNSIDHIPLTKMLKGYADGYNTNIDKVIALLPDGTKKELTYDANWDAAGIGKPVYWVHANKIAYNVGTTDITINKESVLMVFAKVVNINSDQYIHSSRVTAESDVFVTNYFATGYGGKLMNMLTGKLPKGAIAGQSFGRILNKTGSNIIQTNNYYRPSHTPIQGSSIASNTSDAVKVLPLLTKTGSVNKRAMLALVFKEMIWDNDATGKIYYDSGFTNGAREIRNGGYIFDGAGDISGYAAKDADHSILKASDTGIKKYLDIKIEGVRFPGSIQLSFREKSSTTTWNEIGSIDDYIVYSSGTYRRYMVPIYDDYLDAVRIDDTLHENAYVEQLSIVKAGTNLPTRYTNGSFGDNDEFRIINGEYYISDDFGNIILYGMRSIKLDHFLN